uniref:SMB domain-containing protein n=1 Tax=Rhabditophanes sp. KR3021 TaxID=114890 RepID=A0AC35UCK2_9BILA
MGDHLCYCDIFCDRNHQNDGNDCCPDFQAVCRGQAVSAHNLGNECYEGERTVKNCQTCNCVNNRWSCNEDVCLIQEDILHKIQNGRFSWSARNYTEFWGKTLADGIEYRLGTLFPDRSVQNMNHILIKPRELPSHFDAREKWPGLIHGIQDQGNCASSWAFSTTSTSADRLAIITDGRINADLSAQQLLSCNQHRQKFCQGGYLDRAWWYIRKLGVLSSQCYPYTSGQSEGKETCKVERKAFIDGKIDTCIGDSDSDDTSIYKMTPPYRVGSKEEEIQSEIISNGPVQASFRVHEDFFMYAGGVYEHTGLAAEKGDGFSLSGYHSVRIIGWGEDESTGRVKKYWLAANSWGTHFGENGFFRILRGVNHCEIESFVIGAWGKGAKRRRRFKIRKMRKLRFRHF